MAFINFEVDGVVQLSRNLRVLATWIDKLKPFYKDSINIVQKRSNSIFKKQGSNVEKSNKWAWLSSGTKKARDNRRWYYKQRPNNPKTLRWTWNLQDNVTKTVTSQFWIFKYNAPYAVFHQRGGRNLPKRAIIDLNNATNAKIVRTLQSFINKNIWIYNRQI